MELSNVSEQKHEHFVRFADALKAFVVDTFDDANNANPFDVIKEFRSIAGESALSLVQKGSDSNNTTEYNDWELEARFWHLLQLLLSFRTADIDFDGETTVYPYNSSAVFEKELLHKDRSLYQIWIVMVWLQENIKVSERPKNLPTSKWSNTLLSGELKSADLDYPLRNPDAVIDMRDKEQDHIFFRYIYEMLLSGNFEDAYEECKLSENITLCMILCGMQEYINPQIDTQLSEEFDSQQGVKKHCLWRRTVYQLSQNSQLDPYERAIYSYISGTMPNEEVLSKCDWESELLLNLNSIIQIEVENYMISRGKVDPSELFVALPSKTQTLQEVLNMVSAKHPVESEHPVRVLMGAVISNNLETLLHSSVETLLDLVKGYESSIELLDEPYLLRIISHVGILLDIIHPGTLSKGDKVKLLTAYISILKLYELLEPIPVYICFLDEVDAMEAYSFVLSTLGDEPKVKTRQIELMKFLKLPILNILKRTTEKVFAETESNYTPDQGISITFDITNIDKHLIYAVEGLFLGHFYTDAMECTLALARRFLLNGKVGSLEYFIDRNSLENLINVYKLETLPHTGDIIDDDSSVKEILQYANLMQHFKRYAEWQKSVKLLNSDSNIPTLIEKFQEYSNCSMEMIKTFLVELTEDKNAVNFFVLYEIRALYTPYLIIELHKGLVEASKLLRIPKFVKEALGFTELVANENDGIYLLFQSSGKLKKYLTLVAHTATLVEYS
ncbi:Nup84p KNAG_0A05500 [Huiozyma naganishii CBS 8797]|uniref:Nuclear pore complex protein n=1 Tax=Huiozyma naganishii (strain ATCC MYA-139 / BCRC 22969 / CBS 8797 / KCTC 17520 / NBRC 10181 / NCYC 3082 / Yp74L-3) TaxID=1071383 RepID=J7R089_HUIN7|nr:hypothetical protein KNAG_0A05500 [Kazachstania naganishii CBS 8797]CCK68215.1 hypothetical protein KNAG_0A05500 [Kazachstania naganishii CBS 8797]